eukprot:4706309-Prymnesium_polylepis.1
MGEDGISGVQRQEYRSIKQIDDLIAPLAKPSPRRDEGIHEEQDVLVCAGPGTGKTWSLRKLALLLATKLQATGTEGVPLVPLLVTVQRLAVHLRAASAAARKGDLLRFYIEAEYQGDERKLLLQAYELKALIPLIDGIDEGADLKGEIEDFVVKRLAPAGLRAVLSSRPEGVNLGLYK